MKKLLLILICLFVSFEVKSISVTEFDYEDVKIKDCLKYLDKGKILHKFENITQQLKDGNYRKVVVTIFSYNQKTYRHFLGFEVIEIVNRKGKTERRSTNLDFASCDMIDFDKFRED